MRSPHPHPLPSRERETAALVLVIVLFFTATPALAQTPGQVGLVVEAGDGQQTTRCVQLGPNVVTGADLLAASGLDVNVQSSGAGVAVCQIEGVGCSYPAQACFCQCMGGGECNYWNYYTREPGQATWTYSPQGAVLHQLQAGEVEAWVWGNGQTPPSNELTFAAICGASAGGETTLPSTPASQSATSTAGMSPTATAPAGSSAGAAASYWPFGLTLLALILIGLLAWRRLR